MENIINYRTKIKHIGYVKIFDATAKVELSFQRKMLSWSNVNILIHQLMISLDLLTHNVQNLWSSKGTQKGLSVKTYFIDGKHASKWFGKILVKTLTPVLNKFSKYTLKDPFEFVDKLRLILESKSKNSFVVSYDLKLLFTNILLIEVIEISLKELYHSDLRHLKMPEFICKEMLHLLHCMLDLVLMIK